MMCHASKCVAYLLSQVLSNNEGLLDRDCLTNIIIIAGRNSMPATFDGESLAKGVTNQVPSDAGVNLLLQILEQIGPDYHNVMEADDIFRRQPLHYGALYGLTSVCQAILNFLQGPGQDISASRKALLSADFEGFTPLHFALTCNFVPLVRIFLDALDSGYGTGDNAEDDDLRSVLGGLLLALRFQYDGIVYLLSGRHIDDTNQRSTNGQTALHIVAQTGRDDYMRLLLKAASKYQNAVDVSETVYGWTPLFFACVAGHLTLVKLLLQAGASQTILDHQGWTAKEHAAFRGHLAIAGTLEMCNMRDPTGGPASEPLKAFVGAQCHFRTGHSYIIASLGVTQIGRQVTAVNLNCCSSEYSQSLHSNTRYSIEICAPGRNGSSYLVQLPVLDDKIDEPFVSPIDNSSDARLIFNIYRATPMHGTKGILAGSGTALLKRNSHLFGANRESLIREQTIPILERGELNCIGTVTFTFVIVNPPTHLYTPRLTSHSNEGADEVQLVGHRGIFNLSTSRPKPTLIRDQVLVRIPPATPIFS
jgi:glycerophosphodiester phosphodiesterase